MNKTKISDKDCTAIKNAIDTIGSLGNYMTQKLCYEDEFGTIMTFSERDIKSNLEEAQSSINNLEKVFDKFCKFEPSKEGLSRVFGGGTSTARK